MHLGKPRLLRILALLLALPLLLALLLFLGLYLAGIRLHGLGWQQGLTIDTLQYVNGSCLSADATALHLDTRLPLSLQLGTLTLGSCDSTSSPMTQLPWTPAFDLYIGRLSVLALPSLPPMALTIRQRQQQWHMEARHPDNHLNVVMQRATGNWSASGELQASAFLPALLGRFSFQGSGRWQQGKWQGSARVQGQQIGYEGQAPRADLDINASLQQPNWQLQARLDQAMAIAPGWTLSSSEPLLARGNLDGVQELKLGLRADGPTDSAELQLFTDGSGLAGGGGLLRLEGRNLNGSLPLHWSPTVLQLAPARLALPQQLTLELQEPLNIPLASQGRLQLHATLEQRQAGTHWQLQSKGGELGWHNSDWHWQGPLTLAGNLNGYRISGGWNGSASDSGLAGEPLRLDVNGPATRLQFSLPVKGLQAPHWQTSATLQGTLSGKTINGRLDIATDGSGLHALMNAAQISTHLDARLEQLRLQSLGSQLQWDTQGWKWGGKLALQGTLAGYSLQGGWQGQLGPQGLSGQPASLKVSNPELDLSMSLPVSGIKPPDWSGQLSAKGHYQNLPFQGQTTFSMAGKHPVGHLQASSKLPNVTRGGELGLLVNWSYQDEKLILRPGSRLQASESLVSDIMVRPIELTAESPLQVDGSGVTGRLSLQATGALAARWQLPAATASLTLKGLAADVTLRIPAWQSELQASARPQATGYQGSIQASSPLHPAMAQGLGISLQGGQLEGRADWHWQDSLTLDGDVSVNGLAADWGGIPATGGKGRIDLSLANGKLRLQSHGPLQIDKLDVGTPLEDIRISLRSDLEHWQLLDVSARVLGGRVQAPQFDWPSDAYQPVTIDGLDLEKVAALQSSQEPPVALAGKVGGWLPLRMGENKQGLTTFSVQGGDLRNQGKLLLKVLPTAGANAMKQSNMAVQLVMDTLSFLEVNDFQAKIDMSPDGWMDGRVTIKGRNPQQGGQPVVLNYSHRENVLELLRSLRVGDEISQQALEKLPGATR